MNQTQIKSMAEYDWIWGSAKNDTLLCGWLTGPRLGRWQEVAHYASTADWSEPGKPGTHFILIGQYQNHMTNNRHNFWHGIEWLDGSERECEDPEFICIFAHNLTTLRWTETRLALLPRHFRNLKGNLHKACSAWKWAYHGNCIFVPLEYPVVNENEVSKHGKLIFKR